MRTGWAGRGVVRKALKVSDSVGRQLSLLLVAANCYCRKIVQPVDGPEKARAYLVASWRQKPHGSTQGVATICVVTHGHERMF
jgi:hypothetical protein